MAKSSVYFSNVEEMVKDDITAVLPFQRGTLPFRYLGVPLSSRCLRVSDFSPLITKVRGRILNWKAKFLSFGGRLQLVKSVLQSLQLYWMMVFTIPSSVVHTLEGLFRDFLWNRGDPSRGRTRVAWADVCKPKKMGGLGLKRLAIWNRALLTSHVWDILRKRNSVWVSWIYEYRLRGTSFWTLPVTASSTWVWRRLLALREQIRPRFMNIIGNGLSTHAWEDTWREVGYLSRHLSYRLIHDSGYEPNAKVADILTSIQNWPMRWVQRCSDLGAIPIPTLQPQIHDQILWRNTLNHLVPFTVSEVWKSMDEPVQEVSWHKVCWFPKHIPKHSFCLWLAFRMRLPTQDRMQVWRNDTMTCGLCNQGMDSHNHLFFTCSYSASVWSAMKVEMRATSVSDSWEEILDDIHHRRWHPGEIRTKLLFAATIYFLWQERNNRLFTSRRRNDRQLVTEIKKIVMMRLVGLGGHRPVATRDGARGRPVS